MNYTFLLKKERAQQNFWVIINILKYCGIIVKDPTIIQAAEQEAQKIEINEKS